MKILRNCVLLLILTSICTLTLTAQTVSLPPPFGYEVILTWDAPSSSPDPVAGYNVYRAPSGGASYQQINTVELPLTPTTYIDINVLGGNTYDYIVESVDANSVTSLPSNMASVSLPEAPSFIPTAFVIGEPTVN